MTDKEAAELEFRAEMRRGRRETWLSALAFAVYVAATLAFCVWAAYLS